MKSRLAVATLIAASLTLAGPVLAIDCTTIDGNLIASCGFESAGELASWFPDGGSAVHAPGLGETGDAALGTAQDFAGLWVFSIDSPCFQVVPGQEIALGYWVELFEGGGNPPNCTAGWQRWSDAACTVASGGSIGSAVVVPSGGGYVEVRDSHVPPAGTVGMQLGIDCRTSAGAFEVLIDNGYAYWDRPLIQEIPTLGLAGLTGLALLLGAAAFLLLRRRAAEVSGAGRAR